jgi:hypothetical protein
MRAMEARMRAATALVVAAVIAGCGSSSSSGTSTIATYPPLRQPSPAPSAPPHPRHHAGGPPIGQTLRVHAAGTVLSVTINRVIDPLRGSGASLVPGTRAIGVQAVITDDGPGGYDSSSTGDFSVVASPDTARPVFASAGICQTPLRDWDNEISPGETRSGCIAFSVPAHAHVVAVRFSPHAKAHGRATWAVAR